MLKKNNVLALIPARKGSKGLPGKNWRSIAGKPLIQWTIDQALKSQRINDVIVSTNSPDVVQICEDLNVEVDRRIEELSGDEVPISDVIIDILQKKRKRKYNYVILLQPTSPIRATGDIDRCISVVTQDPAGCTCVSVSEVPTWMSPPFCKIIKSGKFCESTVFYKNDQRNIVGRQQVQTKYYYPNGSIYISEVSSFLRHRTFYQDTTIPFVMEKWKSIDIDDLFDFTCAESILQNQEIFEK